MCTNARMNENGPGWTRKDVETMTETSPHVEELIFKINGTWVACFVDLTGKPIRSRVDFNPWTGEELR